jgi:Glycosyl transferase family 11
MAIQRSSKLCDDVTISLTGGLGNQLFQLSFALSQAQGKRVLLDWSLGKPRRSNRNLPEICEYDLPKNVILLEKRKYTWFSVKFSNLILRTTSSYKTNNFMSLNRFIRLAASLGLKLSTLKSEKIITPNGLGFDSNIGLSEGKKFCVGYFQTYKWASREQVFSVLSSLYLVDNSFWLRELESLAKIEKPIVLHLRIGDYEKERNFGRPTTDFYEKATLELWKTGMHKKIWVFSDSPETAKSILPDWILDSARWISNNSDSAALTMEAMRYGYAYVISNSTFSWWGAFLTHNHGASVIAPTPWFSLLPEPLELLPPHWVRRPAGQ